MKLRLRCVMGFLVILISSALNSAAEEVTYIGKLGDERAAVVISGQENQVSAGTTIAGCGTVSQITDTHLIIERRLSDSEKEDLRRQGAAVFSAIETLIPRQDLRLVVGPYGASLATEQGD